MKAEPSPGLPDATRAGPISTESVRAQVARVTTSRTFENAPVLRQFLTHAVDQALAGRLDQLKEYALGVDVFDRGASFDPRIDTIVRVQARRLRSKLEEYYSSENPDDLIVIELPKGRYVPQFRLADGHADRRRASRLELWTGDGDPQRHPEPHGQVTECEVGTSPGETTAPEPRVPTVLIGPPRRVWLRFGVIFGAILIVLVGAFFWRGTPGNAARHPGEHGSPTPAGMPAGRRVAVAIFENRTADAALEPLGRLTAERLIRTIADLWDVEVVPTPIDTVRTRGASSIQNVGSASVLVAGAFYAQQDGLEFEARLLGANDGRLLHAVEPVVASLSNPAGTLDQLEQKVAGAIAIHFDDFFGGLHAVSQPPTLDGYREYRAGLEIFESDYPRAVAHLERALGTSPRFLLPLLVLYFAHANLGQTAKVEAVLARMESQWDRLTPAERFIVEFARTDWDGRGAQTLRVLDDLERLVPGSLFVNHNVVQHSVSLNRPLAAVAAFARVPSSNRSLRHSIGRYRLDFHAQALHMLGEYDRELEEVTRAQQYAPGVLCFVQAEARALIALGRVAEALRVIDRSLVMGASVGRPATPGELMEYTARELRTHGYPEESGKVAARAVEWYRARPAAEKASRAYREQFARALYVAAHWREAGALFAEAAAANPEYPLYRAFLGRIAARTGRAARARELSAELGRISDRHLRASASYQRACIAALLGERDRAVNLLRDALGQGFPYGLHIHSNVDFELLQDYEPYLQLVRPGS